MHHLRARVWLLLLAAGALLAGWALFRHAKATDEAADQTKDANGSARQGIGASDLGAHDETLPSEGGRPSLCAHPSGNAAQADEIQIPLDRLCARLAHMGSPTTTTELDRQQARTVLDQMIDAALVRRALVAERASVPDAEVSAALAALGSPPAGASADAGRSPTGAADPALREQVLERAEMRTLARLRSHIEVTEQEVGAEIAKGAPGIDRGQGIRVNAWVARVAPDADAAVQATAEQAAKAFALAVQSQAPEAAAAQHHMALLPPFVLGANGVEPDLEQAASALREGQWSGAIRTRVGWAVLRAIERVEPQQMNEDLLRARVRLALENRKLQKAREELLESLRSAARIEILVDL